MRSTADRFDAILVQESLSESDVLRRLALEAEELYRAMGTLDRELEELADSLLKAGPRPQPRHGSGR